MSSRVECDRAVRMEPSDDLVPALCVESGGMQEKYGGIRTGPFVNGKANVAYRDDFTS